MIEKIPYNIHKCFGKFILLSLGGGAASQSHKYRLGSANTIDIASLNNATARLKYKPRDFTRNRCYINWLQLKVGGS